LLLDGVLESILNFGAKQNVFFDFVHITDDHARFNKLKDRLYQKLVIHRRLTCGFNIRSLADDQQKIHDILSEYAHLVRAGMVILVTHHRHFLEDIFHASVTKKALQHPDLPLMILHPQVSAQPV
jgi:nucleotide-binding universal stress UspA family protein